MKNGPFYGYPCCCFFWFSKKVEPKTEVIWIYLYNNILIFKLHYIIIIYYFLKNKFLFKVKCIPKSMKKKKGNDSDSESVPTDSDD